MTFWVDSQNITISIGLLTFNCVMMDLTSKAFDVLRAQTYTTAIYLGHSTTILAGLALTYTVLFHVLIQGPLQVLPLWLRIRVV